MALRDFEPYFPDRPPTWTEVLLAVLVAVTLLPRLIAAISSLPAVAITFVVATATLASHSVEDWLHRIGFDGRVLLIFAVFLAVPLVTEMVPEVRPLLNDATAGVLLATSLYFAAFLLKERTVSGWRAPRDASE